MDDDVKSVSEALAALRAEVAELRDYIGEVPSMECGITPFGEWKQEREASGAQPREAGR